MGGSVNAQAFSLHDAIRIGKYVDGSFYHNLNFFLHFPGILCPVKVDNFFFGVIKKKKNIKEIGNRTLICDVTTSRIDLQYANKINLLLE